MASSQQFSLRWNNYLKHITNAFETLRSDEDLVDVTLSCEGKRIRAHKMLLSACSTYFRDLFKENPCQHPVIIFRNVKFDDLAALVDFIYQGEVNVVQEQLDSFMTTAELLAVQGLTDGSRKDDVLPEEMENPNEPEVQLRNVAGKVIINNKEGNSPTPLSPYHTLDMPEMPVPNKRRRVRENVHHNTDKSQKNTSPKEVEKKSDSNNVSEPVEIIPIIPNMKMEMPDYIEQDTSSCSYEDQGLNDGSNKLILDESAGDNQIDSIGSPKQSSDIGYLIGKPGTSAERITQDPIQATPKKFARNSSLSNSRTVVIDHPSHACKLCGKSFWNRDSMYKHMNMHKGTTQCPVCHKVLSRTTHMKRHLKNRHGWMGVLPNSNNVPANSAIFQAQQQSQNARNAEVHLEPSPPFTTISIRESSVERITSSPIP